MCRYLLVVLSIGLLPFTVSAQTREPEIIFSAEPLGPCAEELDMLWSEESACIRTNFRTIHATRVSNSVDHYDVPFSEANTIIHPLEGRGVPMRAPRKLLNLKTKEALARWEEIARRRMKRRIDTAISQLQASADSLVDASLRMNAGERTDLITEGNFLNCTANERTVVLQAAKVPLVKVNEFGRWARHFHIETLRMTYRIDFDRKRDIACEKTTCLRQVYRLGTEQIC